MSHYKSNVRDQVFNLFEVLGVDKAFGEGDYADLDADTAIEMLGEMARLAEGPIAESFADADRNPVSLAIGPEGGWTEDELSAFRSAGWISASLGDTVLRAETAAIAATAIVISSLFAF